MIFKQINIMKIILETPLNYRNTTSGIKRITKATAVSIIVGIGLLWNTNKQVILPCNIYSSTIHWENETVKSDTLPTQDHKLFIYTKSIIKAGINHLIFNL